jgi:enoyl-CoA hydratase/carnithine racemase
MVSEHMFARWSSENAAMTSVLEVDRPAPSVRLLTLNRPDRMNAMTAELCGALHAELAAAAADRSTRAIVLTGARRAFCAGLDLAGYGAAPGNDDGSDAARDHLGNQEHMSRLVLALRSTPQPVIAAVNGPAAGFGLALTLAATSATRRARRCSARCSSTSACRTATSGRRGCCRG